jgi:hypothetical protein
MLKKDCAWSVSSHLSRQVLDCSLPTRRKRAEPYAQETLFNSLLVAPKWSRMTGGLATGTDFGSAGRPLPEPQVRALDFRFWPGAA